MSFWDMLMGMQGGPAALATTPHAPHPAAPMGGPVQMQGLPAELPVATPLPPPRPKEQARMGLDTSALAELSAGAAKYWPDNARAFSEAPGMLQGPPGFIDPTFIGPPRPPEYANMPRREEIGSAAYGRMMDPNTPVGEDEYRALIQRLFQVQQPGYGGSQWR